MIIRLVANISAINPRQLQGLGSRLSTLIPGVTAVRYNPDTCTEGVTAF
jgi:hypothetical protein